MTTRIEKDQRILASPTPSGVTCGHKFPHPTQRRWQASPCSGRPSDAGGASSQGDVDHQAVKMAQDAAGSLCNRFPFSPGIVSEHVAAQQSWGARRQRRDAIIAERGRLYDASKRLIAVEMAKLSPRDYLEHRDDARRQELEELRGKWWEVVNEMWPVPPTEFERIMGETREFRWGLLIVVAPAFVWFLMR